MSYHWKQYGLINHIYVQSLQRLIPKVNDGLMINGNGWLSVMIFTSSSEWTMALFGIPTPILFIACQNNFRSPPYLLDQWKLREVSLHIFSILRVHEV